MATDIPFSYTVRETKYELEILRSLAAGKHPFTGISLPDDSCYQSARVLRALLAAIEALQKGRRMRKLPPNAGKPWSIEEDAELGKCFDQGMTVPDLARKQERTGGGIRSRLVKLGKIKLDAPFEATGQNASLEQKNS